MAAIGLLGGTFNPPHLGHLRLALCALEELELDHVELVPSALPPHKPSADDPGPRRRLAMCELLAAEAPAVGVNPIELGREGPSFTVDTLTLLRARHPDDELTFILGADTALTLELWREPRELLAMCGLAVASRAGSSREDVRSAVAAIDPAAATGIRFLEMPPVDVSSSQVRELAAAGLSVERLVGPAVASYVTAEGLYREG